MSDIHDAVGLPAQLREPPKTGHAVLDEALLSVTDLERHSLAEQLGALTAAHERVNAALAAARSQPPTRSEPPSTPLNGQ